MSDGCKLFVYGVDQYMENEELSVSFFLIESMAGKFKPQFSELFPQGAAFCCPFEPAQLKRIQELGAELLNKKRELEPPEKCRLPSPDKMSDFQFFLTYLKSFCMMRLTY